MGMTKSLPTARHVAVVTGAGFSAPSGTPVYRGGGSSWIDARTERMSHASRYGSHLPALWKEWHNLALAARAAEPNSAHRALARWEQQFGELPRHFKKAVSAVSGADLVIFAGTSGSVWPVAGLLEHARHGGAYTVLLNQALWRESMGSFDRVVLESVENLDALVPLPALKA